MAGNLSQRIENQISHVRMNLADYKRIAFLLDQQGRLEDALIQMNMATYEQGRKDALELVLKWMKEEG